MLNITHLKESVYADPANIVDFSFSVVKQREVFTGELGTKANEIVKNYLTKYEIKTYAWTVLPARICILASPTKQKSIPQIFNELVWLLQKACESQKVEFYKDFLDHVLRRAEDPRMRALDLLEKPAKLGLVNDWLDYPLLGSNQYFIQELAVAKVAA
ncbi:MAG: hypothetical protein V1821_03040 [bacterium]